MIQTPAERARSIWKINALMAVASCALFGLSFMFSGDLSLVPGIPLLMLLAILPVSIAYGLYCSLRLIMDRPPRGDAQPYE
jgi:hypothetical protein